MLAGSDSVIIHQFFRSSTLFLRNNALVFIMDSSQEAVDAANNALNPQPLDPQDEATSNVLLWMQRKYLALMNREIKVKQRELRLARLSSSSSNSAPQAPSWADQAEEDE